MSRLCRLKTKTHGEDGQWAYEEITKLREQVSEIAAAKHMQREVDRVLVENHKLRETIAVQAAVIEKLLHHLHEAEVYTVYTKYDRALAEIRAAIAIPTDSTQILDDVRRAEREKVIEKCIELGAIERDGVFAEEIREME